MLAARHDDDDDYVLLCMTFPINILEGVLVSV